MSCFKTTCPTQVVRGADSTIRLKDRQCFSSHVFGFALSFGRFMAQMGRTCSQYMWTTRFLMPDQVLALARPFPLSRGTFVLGCCGWELEQPQRSSTQHVAIMQYGANVHECESHRYIVSCNFYRGNICRRPLGPGNSFGSCLK